MPWKDGLASRLVGVEVLDHPEVQKVSDHNAVIATFKEDKDSVAHACREEKRLGEVPGNSPALQVEAAETG